MSEPRKRYVQPSYGARKARDEARARAWWLANVGEPQRVVRRPVRLREEFRNKQGGRMETRVST